MEQVREESRRVKYPCMTSGEMASLHSPEADPVNDDPWLEGCSLLTSLRLVGKNPFAFPVHGFMRLVSRSIPTGSGPFA